MTSLLCATIGLLVALGLLWTGRRDLTHPAVAFGSVWFFFVAVAQLQLTDFERVWSLGFSAMVVGGGILFAAAALWAGGTDPLRGRQGPFSAEGLGPVA